MLIGKADEKESARLRCLLTVQFSLYFISGHVVFEDVLQRRLFQGFAWRGVKGERDSRVIVLSGCLL
jgi:hypothetical protein